MNEHDKFLNPIEKLQKAGGASGRKKAVALRYEWGSDILPTVVAKGEGHVAEKILEMAFASGVAVREDVLLTEMLSQVEEDSPIPPEAIMAVAEILGYLYRMNGQMGRMNTKPATDISTESTDSVILSKNTDTTILDHEG